MLKFTLLDNGADSLRSAYENLKVYENIAEGWQHRIKDVVIFLHHGVELLLKYILKQRSPALMFDKIEAYSKAKEELRKKGTEGEETVFDVKSGVNLRTVSLLEALKRVELLCDIEVPETLKSTVNYVNKIRNSFMHYEVELKEDETDRLVMNLQVCYEKAVEFLELHIEYLEDYIQDARFEMTHEEYEEQEAEIYAEIQYQMEEEEAFSDWVEGAYEDRGEGKW